MDECKGCKLRGYCGYRDHTLFKKDGSIYKCPCQSCLIKVMCDKTCHEFEIFRIEYLNKFSLLTIKEGQPEWNAKDV